MRSLFKFIFLSGIAGSLIGISGCGRNVDSGVPPSIPRWVAQSIDTAFVETGIDAVPDGDWIHLEWYKNSEADVTQYIISRDDGTGFLDYTTVADTMYDDQNVTPVSKTYFYQIRAVNRDGNESEPSGSIHYQLLEKSTLGNVVISRNPTFNWTYYVNTAPVGWIFRLQRITGPNQYKYVFVKRDVTFIQPNVSRNYLQDLMGPDSLTSGNYRWRADTFGQDSAAGSESTWGYFTIP